MENQVENWNGLLLNFAEFYIKQNVIVIAFTFGLANIIFECKFIVCFPFTVSNYIVHTIYSNLTVIKWKIESFVCLITIFVA